MAASVATCSWGVNRARVTTKLSNERGTVGVDCRRYRTSVRMPLGEPDDAPLRPRRSDDRPRRDARGAVPRPRGGPPRRPAAARGDPRPDAAVAGPAHREGSRRARDRAAVLAPGRGHRCGPCRRGRRRGHADGVGQDPLLRPARAPGDRRGPVGPGAVPVPDQGARPGPGHGVRGALGGGRAVDHHLDLRRRHAGPDPVRGPRRRAGRRDQPGHAPFGDPAAPHEVVPAVRAAPAHRHRRAPHVPRRVRRPRRERAAAACCGSARTTAASRSSCAAPRRSGTRASSPRC